MSLAASVRWVAAAQAARVLSQLVSMVVLARLLLPEAYGLMAMAMTVTNLAYLFRDLGVSTIIIRQPNLSAPLQATLYWLNLGLGLAMAVLLMALAPLLALAFREPRLAPLIGVLALAFPLSSLGVVHLAVMEREAQFRRLARIEAWAALGGLGLALVLAAGGAGVWSLAAQMLAASALSALQAHLALRWRPARVFAGVELRTLFGFGARFSLFQLVVYLERNADSMIIGRLLSPAALGLYSMAYKVMLFPLQNITAIATRALLPAMSRQLERPGGQAALGQLYLRATAGIALLTAPMMAGLFMLREPFVLLLFGPRWLAVADLLRWLAAVGFIQSLTASTGAVFVALGKARLLLRLGLLGAALQVGAFLIGVRGGIEGVAMAYCLANLLNLLPALVCVALLLDISARRAALALGKPLVGAAIMLLVLSVWRHSAAAAALPLGAGFWLGVALGALSYGAALMLLLKQDLSDMRALLNFGGGTP